MRILCRADASLAIGSGHIVRCATLAQALAEEGHEVEFICRRLPGDLHEWLAEQGFPVRRIDASSDMHSDARLCRAAIAERRFDWLVVDHYELGAEWENAMAGIADGIAAIDDLGRKHECDLLLDQNYPKSIEGGYEGRTPIWCERLLGPAFALVRPEFAKLRSASLCRPRTSVSRLLVFMSGSDPGDETSKALSGIAGLDRPHLAVDVVIGANNPHRAAVERACRAIAEVRLHVQTARMAELMAA
ncbi:MAG TPA: UDP-2,4-diacetamido-2,4,6-trideoxy-beta-L-altropyranose hydrolase, partial [Stellaceae bacterium]|nr:UDP-2,4-diacetamido-2,4,6-trideoxy-beta-L-altropyranose hydrolase [Stellaceae bacterium]